jgi:hypothetical protein
MACDLFSAVSWKPTYIQPPIIHEVRFAHDIINRVNRPPIKLTQTPHHHHFYNYDFKIAPPLSEPFSKGNEFDVKVQVYGGKLTQNNFKIELKKWGAVAENNERIVEFSTEIHDINVSKFSELAVLNF